MLEHYGAPIISAMLLLMFPAIFVIGAWLVDRRSRKRHEPLFRRLYALAAYSGYAVVFFVALSILSTILPHHASTNSVALTISYFLGFSWSAVFFIAAPSVVIFSICGLLTKRLIHHDA